MQKIFIYNTNLFPSFPEDSSQRSQQFSSLRRSGRRISNVFSQNTDIHSTIPPTATAFLRAWNRFIFPEGNNSPIQIEKPEHFSDLYEILEKWDPFFHFDQPEEGIHSEQMIFASPRVTDVDVRYCIILACFNLIHFLKSAVLNQNDFFGKVDYIYVQNESLATIVLINSSNQSALALSPEIYRDLDFHLRTKQLSIFWNQLFHISRGRIETQLINMQHSHPLTRNFLQTRLEQAIRADNRDLKDKIINKLRDQTGISDSVIGTLYDLILENQMQF